jgi:predicted O-methyltransferase YrrM
LARALPSNGRLTTLEIDPRHADLARQTYSQAGVADRIELHVGPALDTLVKLELQEPLDLVFIDADKHNNRAYFEWSLDHVRSGGLIIVDNVLANGRVAQEATDSGYATAVRQFNEYVFTRHGGWHTIIPFYKPDEDNLDGMLIYHKT